MEVSWDEIWLERSSSEVLKFQVIHFMTRDWYLDHLTYTIKFTLGMMDGWEGYGSLSQTWR